jgi:hypothetical protein
VSASRRLWIQPCGGIPAWISAYPIGKQALTAQTKLDASVELVGICEAELASGCTQAEHRGHEPAATVAFRRSKDFKPAKTD